MRAAQRRTHLLTWTILGPVLGLVIVLALALRPPPPAGPHVAATQTGDHAPSQAVPE